MTYKLNKILFIVFIVTCLIIYSISLIKTRDKSAISINNGSITLNTAASTNPSSPDLLSDDSTVYDYYGSALTNYYYKYYMYLGGYDLVWVYPTETDDDFDLYLYSDSSYSTCVASSQFDGQTMDWVVYRPSVNSYMYPETYTYTGTGNAYIEAESGEFITVGISYSRYLGSAEAGELYEVSLSSSTTYTVKLEVPTDANFDLYVFKLNSGSATEYDGHSSTNSGLGTTEYVTFTPSYSDTYAIVVIRVSGSGNGILGINTDSISIYTPSSSTSWQVGTVYDILWGCTGSISYVDIQLYKDDSYYSTIASDVSNLGYYSWSIPSTLPSGSTYRIKIIDHDNSATCAYSSYFSITPKTPVIPGFFWGYIILGLVLGIAMIFALVRQRQDFRILFY